MLSDWSLLILRSALAHCGTQKITFRCCNNRQLNHWKSQSTSGIKTINIKVETCVNISEIYFVLNFIEIIFCVIVWTESSHNTWSQFVDSYNSPTKLFTAHLLRKQNLTIEKCSVPNMRSVCWNTAVLQPVVCSPLLSRPRHRIVSFHAGLLLHFTYVSNQQFANRSYKCFLCHSRGNNNWETNYSTLTKSNENSSQSSKKQRECGESARDSLAYSCLLKNELLGTGIEDIKNVSDDKMGYLSTSNRGLFKYQPPTRQVSRLSDNELQNNDATTN